MKWVCGWIYSVLVLLLPPFFFVFGLFFSFFFSFFSLKNQCKQCDVNLFGYICLLVAGGMALCSKTGHECN